MTTSFAPQTALTVTALWVFPDAGEVEFAADNVIHRVKVSIDEYMDGQIVRTIDGRNVIVNF